MRDHERLARAHGGLDHLLALLHGHGHGLLGEDVVAGLQGLDGQLCVQVGRHGEVDVVQVLLVKHLEVVGVLVVVRLKSLVLDLDVQIRVVLALHLLGPHVAHGDELDLLSLAHQAQVVAQVSAAHGADAHEPDAKHSVLHGFVPPEK